MSGHVFVNPASGPDDTHVDELRDRFAGHKVEECEGAGLAARVRDVVRERPDFVGVAGGDGTISCAVRSLMGTEVPLLVIPAGTRNHFAHDLGIEDVDHSVQAASQPRRRAIALGSLGGTPFVNNASIGMYSELVRRREAREDRMPKRVANLLAAFAVLRRCDPIALQIDGRAERVWLVFVGNGRYGERLLDLTSRESLDEGVLDLRIVRARGRFSRWRVFWHALTGRFEQSKLIERRAASTLHVALAGSGPVDAPIDVAIDGEVEPMDAPLDFSVITGGLNVLVPPPE